MRLVLFAALGLCGLACGSAKPGSASSSSGSASSGSGTSTGRSSGSSGASTGSSGSSGGGAIDPGATGPFTVQTALDQSGSFAGQSVAFDLYFPADASAHPGVVVSHGLDADKSAFVNWGAHLASWGFVVAVPSWGNAMAYTAAGANADSTNALLAWMDAQSSVAGSPLAGRLDGVHHGLVGHSYGGLMVYVAASRNASVGAVIGLDPSDDPTSLFPGPGVSVTAAGAFAGFGAVLQADAAACNVFGNDQSGVYDAFSGPKLRAHVDGASHCDCEDPVPSGCGVGCGNPGAARQLRFQRYATAALLFALGCDARARPWLDGASIAADTGLADFESHALACP